jgi:hypothetical protein
LRTKAGLVWKRWQDMTNLPIGLSMIRIERQREHPHLNLTIFRS